MQRLVKKFSSAERGSAAIMGVLVMMLLGLMGAGYIALSRTEVNISADFRDGVAAQYLAEAGARRAIMELFNNSAWAGASEQMGSSNSATRGRYTVTVSTPPGDTSRRLVVSAGQVNRARRQVVFYVKIPTGGAASVYDYAIFAGSSMTIHNKAQVIGSVRSNGSLDLKNNSVITEEVIVHGQFTDQGAIYDTKKLIKSAPTITFPTFYADEYKKKAGGTANGIYFYDNGKKTLSIDSSVQKPVNGSATIFATGDVVIDPKSVIGNGNDYFLIIAQGSITVKSNTRLQKVVLIALGGNIDINADVQMTGSAIANTDVTINGGGSSATTITWDLDVIKHFGLPTGQASPFRVEPFKPYQSVTS